MGSLLIFVVSGKPGIMEKGVHVWGLGTGEGHVWRLETGGTCVETHNGIELQLNAITFE